MHVYFAIDRAPDPDPPAKMFRVWRRSGNEATAEMIGRYPTLDMAMSSMDVDWRPGRSRLIEAWGVRVVDDPVRESVA